MTARDTDVGYFDNVASLVSRSMNLFVNGNFTVEKIVVEVLAWNISS